MNVFFKRFNFFSYLECDSSEDTLALWIWGHDSYAQYLLNNGRYKEAFLQFQDAFLTCCEMHGNTHSQSLVLLNSLGKISFLIMRFFFKKPRQN